MSSGSGCMSSVRCYSYAVGHYMLLGKFRSVGVCVIVRAGVQFVV